MSNKRYISKFTFISYIKNKSIRKLKINIYYSFIIYISNRAKIHDKDYKFLQEDNVSCFTKKNIGCY